MDSPPDVVRAYFAALSGSDLQAVLELFDEEAVVTASGMETAAGKDALRATYEGTFSRVRIKEKPEVDRVLESDGLAAVETHSSGTVTQIESGEATEVGFRELFVLRRSDDRWRIVDYMFN
jgi:uncharacterized protein (TIGR02246 family)